MANEENLTHKLTVNEQRAGGRKSGEVRRQRKTWAQLLERLGSLPTQSEKNKEILRKAGLSDEEMISDMVKMYQLDAAAQKGDIKAIETQARIRGEFAAIHSVNENHNIEMKPLVDLTKRKKNGED
jgi:hypothetical protein